MARRALQSRRRIRGTAVRKLILALGIVLSSSSPAFADTFGGPPAAGGGTSGDSFFVGIIAPGQGGGGGTVSAGDPNGPAPYKYTWVPGGVFGGRGPSCDVGFGQPGWLHTL